MPRIEPLPQQDFRAVYESTFLPLSFVNNYFRLIPFCYSDFSNMHACSGVLEVEYNYFGHVRIGTDVLYSYMY